mmetsp:Transcript_4299/g.11148  ORF Transcript_4299/g.11148 Transcript_4299/m.11148 type:complete len:291 (+) Transcript_4299:1398-2270(+)
MRPPLVRGGLVDTRAVQHQRVRRRIDRGHNRLRGDGIEEDRFVVRYLPVAPAGHLARAHSPVRAVLGLVALAQTERARAAQAMAVRRCVASSVRAVRIFGREPAMLVRPAERVVWQPAIARLLARARRVVVGIAAQELLYGEPDEVASHDCVDALERGDRGECPRRSAGALIDRGSHLLSRYPVLAGGRRRDGANEVGMVRTFAMVARGMLAKVAKARVDELGMRLIGEAVHAADEAARTRVSIALSHCFPIQVERGKCGALRRCRQVRAMMVPCPRVECVEQTRILEMR